MQFVYRIYKKSSKSIHNNSLKKTEKKIVVAESSSKSVNKFRASSRDELKMIISKSNSNTKFSTTSNSENSFNTNITEPLNELKAKKTNTENESKNNEKEIKRGNSDVKQIVSLEEVKHKSNNVPKLKIDLPRLTTKITVPKNVPHSAPAISNDAPPAKKVRFSFSVDQSAEQDLHKFAQEIGLKPVNRDADEYTIMHKKRKKSKHSKELQGKKKKMHAELSPLNENLKMKFKVIKQSSEHRHTSEDLNKNINTNSAVETTQKPIEPMVSIPNLNLTQTNNQKDTLKTTTEEPAKKNMTAPEIVKKIQVPKTTVSTSTSTQTFFRAKMGSFNHKTAISQRPTPYPANLSIAIGNSNSKPIINTQNPSVKKHAKPNLIQTNIPSKFTNNTGQQTIKQLTFTNLQAKIPALSVSVDSKILNEKSKLKIGTNSAGLSLNDITKANNFYKTLAEVQKNYIMSPQISSSQSKATPEPVQSSMSITEKNNVISIEPLPLALCEVSKPKSIPIPLAKIKKSVMDAEHVTKMKEMIFHTTVQRPKDALIKVSENTVRTSPLQDKIPLFLTEIPKTTADFSKPAIPPIDSIDPVDSIEILARDYQLARDIKKIQDSLCTMNNSDMHSLINKLQQASKKIELEKKNIQTPINLKKPEMENKTTSFASMQNLSIRQIPNPIQMLYNRSKKKENDNQTLEKEKFEDIEDLIKVSKLKKDQKNSNLEKLVKLINDKKNDKNNNNHDISVEEKM